MVTMPSIMFKPISSLSAPGERSLCDILRGAVSQDHASDFRTSRRLGSHNSLTNANAMTIMGAGVNLYTHINLTVPTPLCTSSCEQIARSPVF